jgi:hypothetical protein
MRLVVGLVPEHDGFDHKCPRICYSECLSADARAARNFKSQISDFQFAI